MANMTTDGNCHWTVTGHRVTVQQSSITNIFHQLDILLIFGIFKLSSNSEMNGGGKFTLSHEHEIVAERRTTVNRTTNETFLQCLYLEGNELTSLPENFFDCLPNLQWLDLRQNYLSSIPSTYIGMFAKFWRCVVAEVILPHFRVRPFCVVVSSSLWNPEVPGSNLGTVRTYSALSTSLVTRMSRKNPCSNLCGMLCGYKFHHRLWCLLWYKCRPV